MSSLAASPFVTVEPFPPEVASDLRRVESKLTAVAHSSREPRMTEITDHLIGAGGKRIRPLAALLVFHACLRPDRTDQREPMTEMATALELIHSATLLHDDIIDGSDQRRGRPSALRRFGLADTLVAGDFVFSRAFEICARFEERIVRWAADACISLTEGEMLQGRLRNNPDVTLKNYLDIIARKTASLFRQGARAAAYLAGADEALQALASDMGHHIGMAFQMIDDLLDVIGHSAVTGKPTAADLRDGNPSLPVVLALRRDPEVRRLFAKSALDENETAEALQRIRACGVLGEVRELANGHIESALGCVRILPNPGARDALASLVDNIAHRSL